MSRDKGAAIGLAQQAKRASHIFLYAATLVLVTDVLRAAPAISTARRRRNVAAHTGQPDAESHKFLQFRRHLRLSSPGLPDLKLERGCVEKLFTLTAPVESAAP
jgi:hypothetical protein